MQDVYIGKKFGRVTVISFEKMNSRYERIYSGRCDCGVTRPFKIYNLKSGMTKSCGCLNNELRKTLGYRKKKTHDDYGSRTYRSWRQMKSRVRAEYKEHRYYFDKDITVCEQWNDYPAFLADMGKRPEGMTLDRIHSNGNYEPTNCRWATPSTQSRNRAIIKQYDYRGKKFYLTDLAQANNISLKKLWERINVQNWSVEKSVETR